MHKIKENIPKSYHIGITKYQNGLSRKIIKIYEKIKSYQEVIIK